MYGYIKGIVTKVTPKNIIVENNGIGYLIIVPNPYIYHLADECMVYLHQYVKEDILDLYGFSSYEEKDLFLKLISVSGIGPKSALSILASGSINGIINAIEEGNAAYLKRFPGIGAKASQQIILDLKGKISFEDTFGIPTTKMSDVADALLALGYNKKEISKIEPKLDMTLDEGELVKQALKLLVK